MKVLIAGMGNQLQGDDGFGVAVAQLLAARDLGGDVTVREFGIGGIHLVQELLSGYDALLIVDAVDRRSKPGTLHVLEPKVPELPSLPFEQRRDFLADTHWADPGRVLILAKALGVLPRRVLVVGCQPEELQDLSPALSATVERTLPRALTVIDEALERLM